MAFKVCDSNGQRLAHIYFEEEPGRRAAAKLLSKEEARRIAANIAKLPELLTKSGEKRGRHLMTASKFKREEGPPLWGPMLSRVAW